MRLKNISLQVVGVMQGQGYILGNNEDMNTFIPVTTMANKITGNTSPYGT